MIKIYANNANILKRDIYTIAVLFENFSLMPAKQISKRTIYFNPIAKKNKATDIKLQILSKK